MLTPNSTNSDLASQIQDTLAVATNYYQWIYNQLSLDMGSDMLEIGCGGGHFTHLLAKRTGSLLVADIELQYLESLAKTYSNKPTFSTTTIDLNQPDWGDKYKSKFDTVILLNVLEHIEDDLQVLKQIHNVLRPKGKLLLMVPAFQIIYGSMDAADNHYRRYSKGQILKLLTSASFNTKWARYMNMPGFFAWFLNGRILKRSLLPEGQLGFYNKIIPIVERVESLLPLPFGQSVISVAERF